MENFNCFRYEYKHMVIKSINIGELCESKNQHDLITAPK